MYKIICKDHRIFKNRGVELLLALHVGTDTGEVGARSDPLPVDQRSAGGSDGDDVTVGNRRRQIFGGFKGSTGAHACDGGTVHQPDGHAGLGAEDHDQTYQIGQPLFNVRFPEGDGLVAEYFHVGQIAGLDIHIGVTGVKFIEYRGPDNGPVLTLQTIDHFIAGDGSIHGELFAYFFCGYVGDVHGSSPFAVRYGSEKQGAHRAFLIA